MIVILVVCVAVSVGFFWRTSDSPTSTKPVVVEYVGPLPDVFEVDVCRIDSCKKIQIQKADGFDRTAQKMCEALGVNSPVSILNQTGASVSSLSGLYSVSEERGKERGLQETWRGVKLLVGDEKFFWPLPKSGKGRNDPHFNESFVHYMSDGHRVVVKPLFDSPRVYEISNFLTDEECDHLITRAKQFKKANKFVESSVGGDDATKTKSDVRTSTQAWIGPAQHNDDAIFARLRQRASEFLGIGLELAEDTQVVHYSEKQQYLGHHDYTPASSIPSNKYFAAGGNRLATLLYYLNDVPEGGDTRFPYAQEVPPYPKEESWKLYQSGSCSSGGMGVQPERGKAILFYSLLEEGHMEGAVDPTSLHAACPAGKQEKWLANQWFRNKRVFINGKWHLYDNIW